MKQAPIGVFVVILIGGINLGATASETKSATKVPEDNVIVSEDTFIVFADEPQHHFMRAFEYFLKHDWEAAAVEIRKGAAFLKLEAARAAADAEKGLTASVQMLEKLADDKGKKVRSWEGVKARKTSNLNSYYNLPLTFSLHPFACFQHEPDQQNKVKNPGPASCPASGS